MYLSQLVDWLHIRDWVKWRESDHYRMACLTQRCIGLSLEAAVLAYIGIGMFYFAQDWWLNDMQPTSPLIPCGHSTPPLLFAIQCVSLNEARLVSKTIQSIVATLPPRPDHEQLLVSLNNTYV